MIKKILTIILFAFALFAQQSPLDQNQFMLAESYEQRGDFAKAVEIIETLNKKDPANIQYFNKLNSLYLQLKKYDESAALINSRINITPQDISLYGLLGSTYYTAGDRTKAYQVWDDATEKFKANNMSYRIIANYAIEKRDFEKAIELLNLGKQSSKDPFLFSYELGELYSITMRYREAAEEYCSLIKSDVAQYAQLENKILSYSTKPNALDETIEVVKKYRNQNINFNYLLARLFVEKKLYDDGFELYKDIDKKQNSNGKELYSFGEFLFSEEEYSTAAKVFKHLVDNYSDQPNVSSAKLGYAKTQEALLIKNYNELNPEWKKFYKSAKIEDKNLEPVIRAYEEIIKAYKHSEVSVEAHLHIGMLYYHLQNDLSSAEKYLNIITETYPTSRFASLAFVELGNIELQRGNLVQSEKYFKGVSSLTRAAGEDKSFANYQLARLSSFKNDFDNARRYLASVIGNLKDNVANDAIEFSILLNTAKNDSSNLSLYCQAEFLVEQKKFSEAKDLYLQLSQNPQAFVFSSIARLRVAEMMIAVDNYSEAISALALMVEEGEKNIYADKALYLQGQIYQYGLKESAKAVESYESLLAKFPKSLYLDDARQNIIELKKKIS
jgi:tetratricopeptide (TPR) repeat protein